MSVIDSEQVNNLDFDSLIKQTPNNVIKSYMISMSDEIFQNGIKNIQLDIPIEKFDAVRGSSLTDYVKNIKNVSIKGQFNIESDYRTDDADLTTLNSIGCYLSHVSLWYQIVTEQLTGMYIFESDAKCTGNLDITDFLKTDGDILLFGSLQPSNSILLPIDFMREKGMIKINHFYQTHAYYITYRGALICLKYAFPIEVQVDSYMSYLTNLSLLNIYAIHPSQCTQTVGISTIQNKSVKKYIDIYILIAIFCVIISALIIALIITNKKM